jgi:hypothetical protein
LIALGLTTSGWPAEKCSYFIDRICSQAFSRRTGRDIPGIGRLLEAYSKTKFSTEALEAALKGSFQEDQLLFGGSRGHDEHTSVAKVAVTATTSNGNVAVFGNYNRRCIEKRELSIPSLV